MSLKEEAARWFVRMHNAPPDHPDRGRFEAWLAAHTAHAAEYAAYAAVWSDFDSSHRVRQLADAAELQQQADRAMRRKLLRGGLATVALVLGSEGGCWAWRSQTRWQTQVHTAIGRMQEQRLPDGSLIVADAHSALDVQFSRGQRRVTLRRGAAIFDVAADPARPFIVDSGDLRVTVLGTRFAINRLTASTRVSVERGHVAVEAGPRWAFWRLQRVELIAGQVAELDSMAAPDGAPGLRRSARRAADAFAFQRRTVVFDNASLLEVAETLSRYRAVPLAPRRDAEGVAPGITAVVQLDDIDAFLHLLPQVSPVRLVPAR